MVFRGKSIMGENGRRIFTQNPLPVDPDHKTVIVIDLHCDGLNGVHIESRKGGSQVDHRIVVLHIAQDRSARSVTVPDGCIPKAPSGNIKTAVHPSCSQSGRIFSLQVPEF